MPARGRAGTAYAPSDPNDPQAYQTNGVYSTGNLQQLPSGGYGAWYAPGQTHDVIKTYGTGGSLAAGAWNFAGDAYNWASGNPRGQKEAYDAAAKGYQDLGNTAGQMYRNLNTESQGYYDPAWAAYRDQQNNRSTQQGDYYSYMQGQAAGPTNDETALGAFKDAAGRPTAEEDYLGYARDAAGRPTNAENSLDYFKNNRLNDTYGTQLSDVEQLYNERKGGYDPAAAYEDQRATDALNTQFAARGGYNSGAGIRSIGDYYSNVGAQRSKQLADLAGQSSSAAVNRANYREGLANDYFSQSQGADTSRLAVNNAYGEASSRAGASRRDVNEAYGTAANRADASRNQVNTTLGNAATGASKEQSDYYGGLTDNATKLASQQAGIDSDLGSKAIEAYKSGQVASIQAYLAKAGVDAKAIQAFTDSLKTVVDVGSKA